LLKKEFVRNLIKLHSGVIKGISDMIRGPL